MSLPASAARARALPVMDAINEGAGADLWETQLPGFVAEVARYPWVALVITLRDVYESSVVPGGTPAGMTGWSGSGLGQLACQLLRPAAVPVRGDLQLAGVAEIGYLQHTGLFGKAEMPMPCVALGFDCLELHHQSAPAEF